MTVYKKSDNCVTQYGAERANNSIEAKQSIIRELAGALDRFLDKGVDPLHIEISVNETHYRGSFVAYGKMWMWWLDEEYVKVMNEAYLINSKATEEHGKSEMEDNTQG